MTKIARRTLLKTLSGFSVGSALSFLGCTSTSNSKIKTINTDILVVGGGTAGVIAAIQAARAGCSVILVENGSQLGGTTTTGGVAFPGLFHAWGKQVIGGIGWELVIETVEMGDGELPDFSIPTGRWHWKHQIHINPYVYTMLAEEKCLQSGVQIRYYETPVNVNFNGKNWEVETMGKGCQAKIICKQLIDCSGNAMLASLAGFNVLRENETQPGTLMFKLDGYDMDNIDVDLVKAEYLKAIEKGELDKYEFRNNIVSLLNTGGNNIQHIAGADSTTSETHTVANIKGRSSLIKHLRFLRSLPGCENIHVASMQTETAVRETYRIDGVYKITRDDYISGKVFDDSLCYSFYPIDLHDKNGVKPKHLQEGTVPTIPLRALIPKNSNNFLVAGRCVSSDRLANSALRVQASCMAMGQAAGAAAALSAKNNGTPSQAHVDEIKALIGKYGGIVPV